MGVSPRGPGHVRCAGVLATRRSAAFFLWGDVPHLCSRPTALCVLPYLYSVPVDLLVPSPRLSAPRRHIAFLPCWSSHTGHHVGGCGRQCADEEGVGHEGDSYWRGPGHRGRLQSVPLLVWGQGAPMRGSPVSCTLGGGFAVLLGLRVFFVAMLCCSRACPPM